MKLRVDRYDICIIPEGPTDEAYLEEVLGLLTPGATARIERVNAIGLSCWAYARITKQVPDNQYVSGSLMPPDEP